MALTMMGRGVVDFTGAASSVAMEMLVGLEELRGVRTTRYRAVVGLEKEAAGQGARVREAQEEMVEQISTSKLPVEVWIYGENHVRRYELETNAPGGDATARTRMIAEYYDLGTPAEVQAPPEQTMDGSKLLSGAQAAAQ